MPARGCQDGAGAMCQSFRPPASPGQALCALLRSRIQTGLTYTRGSTPPCHLACVAEAVALVTWSACAVAWRGNGCGTARIPLTCLRLALPLSLRASAAILAGSVGYRHYSSMLVAASALVHSVWHAGRPASQLYVFRSNRSRICLGWHGRVDSGMRKFQLVCSLDGGHPFA